jgi:hypothetical protein
MNAVLDALVAGALHHALPADANQAIATAREHLGSEFSEALSYEVVVPALDPDGFLTQRALPKLVYFLDCRGAKLPSAPGVFVSLFTAGGLYFLDAGEAVKVLAQARDLSFAELVRRYGQAGVGDPPLLGS